MGIRQLIWYWGVSLSNLTGILELFLHFSWTLGSLYVMTGFYPNVLIELYLSWKIICWWRSFFGDSSILIASSSFIVNWNGLIKNHLIYFIVRSSFLYLYYNITSSLQYYIIDSQFDFLIFDISPFQVSPIHSTSHLIRE